MDFNLPEVASSCKKDSRNSNKAFNGNETEKRRQGSGNQSSVFHLHLINARKGIKTKMTNSVNSI
jgi:hypothetical protein